MWNDPRLLNAAAGIVFAIGVLLLGTAAYRALQRSALVPLRTVSVGGALAHTGRDEIERAVHARLTGNLLGIDLDAVRSELERLPWVRRVDLRRVWPDRLEVTLVEHVALARWGSTGAGMLVNTYGERFAAHTDADLPVLAGPGGSEALVAQRYARFSEQLASLGMSLQAVTLTPRHAWQLTTRGGLQVALGRDVPGDPVEARLARFARSYSRAAGALAQDPAYADLRYPNGFAVRLGAALRDARPARRVKG